jgi:hypothetical protein
LNSPMNAVRLTTRTRTQVVLVLVLNNPTFATMEELQLGKYF